MHLDLEIVACIKGGVKEMAEEMDHVVVIEAVTPTVAAIRGPSRGRQLAEHPGKPAAHGKWPLGPVGRERQHMCLRSDAYACAQQNTNPKWVCEKFSTRRVALSLLSISRGASN